MKSVFFALMIVVVAAGCTGSPGDAKAAAATSLAPAPEATVGEDTGSIAGQVLGDDQLPISAVDVAIIGSNMSVVSDAGGRFTFNDLAPGDYTVAAGRLGYDSQSKRVSVLAGETTQVTFLLTPLQVLEPRVESFIGNGFMQFALTVPSVYFSFAANNVGVIPPSVESWSHNATMEAVSVVSTGTWQKPNEALPSWMKLDVKNEDGLTATKSGSKSITVQLAEMALTKPQKITISFVPAPGCTSSGTDACTQDPPNRAAQVVVQQKSTVYTDIFYVDPAPEGYVAGPK